MFFMRRSSIGVFDSGFGGLDILRGIVSELPQYDYIYLGDTARTPYGTRSKEVVCQFTKEAVNFFFKNNCELVIFACNTASSDALRYIQHEYVPTFFPDKKVLGVLIPAAEEAVTLTKNKKIGVIATEGTVRSGAFMRELHAVDGSVEVFQQACPLLVPIIEAGEHQSDIARLAVKQYLSPLLEKNIDTLILGCTHYGLIEPLLQEFLGTGVTIVSEARVVPQKLKNYLERHAEIETTLSQNNTVRFYSTDVSDKFSYLGSQFFGAPIDAKRAVLV